MIRRAAAADVPAVAAIYAKIAALEARRPMTGWKPGIYPTEEYALCSFEKGELFVTEEDGDIIASGRINQEQQAEYTLCKWCYEAPPEKVMVLHTLCVAPEASGRGVASAFLRFYEEYAAEHCCTCLRLDTNVINSRARALYAHQGYREADIIRCTFNRLDNIDLVMLEKPIKTRVFADNAEAFPSLCY